ncbi:MAG: hypothetical protein HC828_20975, partial [Blastochloris sp.]|nr:hypothetical protein [Blastochloris sp.]
MDTTSCIWRPASAGGGGPANPQDLNRYSYGLNNPLRYTDPSGWQVEGGSAEQGPPVVSDPYYRDGNGEPYVCATPGCNLVTTPAEPLWTNGEDTTGPGPYGAQPQ